MDNFVEMQIDNQKSSKDTSPVSRRKPHPSRIKKKKKLARKNRSSIVFATHIQHKKRKAAGKKTS
jgi:hypothetical protein